VLPPAAQITASLAGTSPAEVHGRKPHANAGHAAFADLLAPEAAPPAAPARDSRPGEREAAPAAATQGPAKEDPRPDDRADEDDRRSEAGSPVQPVMPPAAPAPAPAEASLSPPAVPAKADLAGVATTADAAALQAGPPAPDEAAPSAAAADCADGSPAGSPALSPAAFDPLAGDSPDAGSLAAGSLAAGSFAAPPATEAPASAVLGLAPPNAEGAKLDAPPGSKAAQPPAGQAVAVAGPAVGATAGAVGERAATLVPRDADTAPSGMAGARPQPEQGADPRQGKHTADLAGTHESQADAKPADQPLAPDAALSHHPDTTVELRPAAEARTPGATGPQPLPAQAAVVTLSEVAVTIATRFKSGESRFQIRLDPAELGRIDVDLTVDKGGRATTTLTVERMDTLDLLQRDSRALERALGAAGFKADPGSLQFNLRDPGQGNSGFQPGQGHAQDHRHAQDQGAPRRFMFAGPGEGQGPTARMAAAPYPSRLSRLGGLDIRV
jgi:hypothetical protein